VIELLRLSESALDAPNSLTSPAAPLIKFANAMTA